MPPSRRSRLSTARRSVQPIVILPASKVSPGTIRCGSDHMTLRLHMNEHPLGCSPAVLAAIRAVSREDIARYEDPAACTRLAERWFGVDDEWLLLTNGLDDGLNAATQGMAATTRRQPRAEYS